jgi:hypothetical protein
MANEYVAREDHTFWVARVPLTLEIQAMDAQTRTNGVIPPGLHRHKVHGRGGLPTRWLLDRTGHAGTVSRASPSRLVATGVDRPAVTTRDLVPRNGTSNPRSRPTDRNRPRKMKGHRTELEAGLARSGRYSRSPVGFFGTSSGIGLIGHADRMSLRPVRQVFQCDEHADRRCTPGA